MIRFTVVWGPDAEAALAAIWTDSSDRAAVTSAADAIDATLSDDPLGTGIPVSEGLLRLDYPPLKVLFSVAEPDRLVRIASVRRI